MRHSKQLFRNINHQVLTPVTEQKPSRLVELAEPFVSEHTNWLVLLGVGKIADFFECGVQGVILFSSVSGQGSCRKARSEVHLPAREDSWKKDKVETKKNS
jgi:hypothetical protein